MGQSTVLSSFVPLKGQPQAIELLSRAVVQGRVAPAYLFAGAAGVGRSLAASCFAELLLARQPLEPIPETLSQRIRQRNHPDLLWVEPTYLHQGKFVSAAEAAELGIKRRSLPEIRLEQIREIAQFLARPPLEAPRSVIVIKQADSMAEAAANGLLKTLEEPGQATLILIAPSPDSLLPTLVSRCQRIPFSRLDAATMTQILSQAGQGEILEHPEILALGQGSPGEAIVHWQQLQTISAELLAAAAAVPATLKDALDLARQIARSLDAQGQLWLVDYLQQHHWRAGQPQYLPLLENARKQLLQYVQPQLVWEVTLMKMQESG